MAVAALTTLARIKLVAQDDAYIQSLSDGGDHIVMVLEQVAVEVVVAIFGTDTEAAQRYLAAHYLSLGAQPVGGRGPLSSVNIGGISRSYTLPYLNQKTVLGSTQYGLMYMEYRDRNVVSHAVVIPIGTP